MAKGVQKKKILKEVVLFLVKFNVLLIPFYAVIYFDVNFYQVQSAFAAVLESILSFLCYQVSRNDYFLFLTDTEFPVDISRDCIGWKSAYSLFALVMAAPGKLKDKYKFLVLWIPVLFVFNFGRVLSTLLFGLNFGLDHMEFLHSVLWEQVTIIVVIVVWYLWLRATVEKLAKR